MVSSSVTSADLSLFHSFLFFLFWWRFWRDGLGSEASHQQPEYSWGLVNFAILIFQDMLVDVSEPVGKTVFV